MKTLKKKAIIFTEYKKKTDGIKAAKEAGYKAVLITGNPTAAAFELFDDVFETDISNREALNYLARKIREKYAVKAIISNYEDFVVQRSYLAGHLSLPSSSVYSACCTRNKVLQRHALNFMKENIPFRIVKSEKTALRALKELGGDVYLKSIAGIKSKFIFHIQSEDELKKALETFKNADLEVEQQLFSDYNYCNFNFTYPDPKKTLLVEKAVYGSQITVVSLIGSYKIWHAPSLCDVYTASDISRDDSFLAFRILPSKFSDETISEAKKVAETAIGILGLRYCAAHIELLITPEGGIKIIEIASRMGGYRPLMYKEAYNIDLSKSLVRAALNKNVEARKDLIKYVSLVEIFPEKEGRLVDIEGFYELKQDPMVSHIRENYMKGEKVGLAKEGHHPVLCFLISGKSYEEVYKKSLDYQKTLKVKLI